MDYRSRPNTILRSSLSAFAASLIVILPGIRGEQLQASGLTLKAGIGYEFLSQEYFLDSSMLAGPDSLLTNWALTTNYLDDLKGRVSLTYSPFDDRRIELRADYEQTAECLRVRLNSGLITRIGKGRLSLAGELAGKKRYEGLSEFGDTYIQGYGRASYSRPVSESVNLRTQVKVDGVQFDTVSSYSYSHFRLGGKLGLEKTFENFSFADLNVFVSGRHVPDIAELDYLSLGSEASYFGFYNAGELDLHARFERQNYRQPDDKDDHYCLELDGQNRVRHGQTWFSRQQVAFELVLYSPKDSINYDYSRTGLTAQVGFERNGLTLAVGPNLEFLVEEKDELLDGEDYVELGVKIDLDYLKPGRLFCSVESISGNRNLATESEFQSDFLFERLSLIGDLTLTGCLCLDLLFSAEWEWHDRSQDNSRIYLLSASLTCTF